MFKIYQYVIIKCLSQFLLSCNWVTVYVNDALVAIGYSEYSEELLFARVQGTDT